MILPGMRLCYSLELLYTHVRIPEDKAISTLPFYLSLIFKSNEFSQKKMTVTLKDTVIIILFSLTLKIHFLSILVIKCNQFLHITICVKHFFILKDVWLFENYMSRVMRKIDVCIYENKGTDQSPRS